MTWKQDDQTAQYKRVDPDHDYPAHRVYLISRTARDRLIVIALLLLLLLLVTGVTFNLRDFS